jgi:hypothetical protein
MGRFGTTIELMKASMSVISHNKRLLILPACSLACMLLVVASFVAPIVLENRRLAIDDPAAELSLLYFEPPGENAEPLEFVRFGGAVFAFYLANYFVIIFFNSALVAAALFWMRSGNSSVGAGLAAASKRLPQIFGWALLSATVGLLLKVIEGAHEKAGRVVSALLGTAWTVMTYLVVPVLVVEGKGPIASLKESTSLLRKSWGQQLAGGFMFGLMYFLAALLGAGVVAAGWYLFELTDNGAILVVSITIAAVYWAGLALVSSVQTPVFQAALYVYAKEGGTPGSFGEQLLENAFRPKG